MDCELWTGKLDSYADGELSSSEARAVAEHLRSCAACSAKALRAVQLKRAIQVAGQRYAAGAQFRSRIEKTIGERKGSYWQRGWIPAFAAALVVLAAGLWMSLGTARTRDRQLLSELTDQYVATLASTNPVDVVSTDRHTVKPWFEGKIPFSFNLPDLQNSPFTLVGGKVVYLNQSSGAQLIFRLRQHQISTFIFQESALGSLRDEDLVRGVRSFTLRTWPQNGLRYFVIGDVGAQDIAALSNLLKAAG